MKKLLTERTFKRLIKTFINEDISKIKSQAILSWIKNFNEKAGTSYHEDDLANIADYVLKVLKPIGRNKINGKTIVIDKIFTDEELRAVMKLIDDDKASKASASIGGFSNVDKSITGFNFDKLLPKDKFKLIQQYRNNPAIILGGKNEDYKVIDDDGIKEIETVFETNNARPIKMAYAVWFSLIVFKGWQQAEDASLINNYISILNSNPERFEVDNILKIKNEYDYRKFYDTATKIQSENSGVDKSSGSAHVSTLISKYGKGSKYPLYQGDFIDEKYGNTYAFFLIPILREDEIDIYQPILREIGTETTWCFAYGWADKKQDNKSHIKRYCTQDTTRILINKAYPFNKVNGKFAMNKIESQFMNISDQPVLG